MEEIRELTSAARVARAADQACPTWLKVIPGWGLGMIQDGASMAQGELMRAQVRVVWPGRWIKRAQDDPGWNQEGTMDGPG